MRKKIEPGEWEVDERGKRFRRVGNSIEYAPTITTTYGEFEVGHVPQPPKIVEAKRPQTWGDCPFRSKCTTQCARYTESGCGIVTGAPPVTGQRCPFADKHFFTTCKETCALWTLCNSRKENS